MGGDSSVVERPPRDRQVTSLSPGWSGGPWRFFFYSITYLS